MKKKMLFMAAIAGLVSLGSCVKDDVSGSVEAVRNAKAQELLGKAAEANANAAKANAEAALTNATQSAEVALKQAEAALKAAEAEAKQLDTQLKKEGYAAELESILSQFEATTAANKAAMQTSLNAYQDALNAASVKDLDHIVSLIARYNAAYSKFTSAQQAVLVANANLAKAKVGQENAEEKVADLIQNELNTIAQEQAKIEYLESLSSTAITANEQAAAAANKTREFEQAKAEFDQSEEVKAFVAASKVFAEKLAAYTAYVNLDGSAPGLIDKLVPSGYLMALTPETVAPGEMPYMNYLSYAFGGGTKAQTDDNLGGDLINAYDRDNDGTPETFVNDEYSGTIDNYAVSEAGKYAFNDYYDNNDGTDGNPMGTVYAKNAWDDAKALLGTDADKKDTKATMSDGSKILTKYAELALVKANEKDAEDALKTASENLAAQQKNLDDGMAELATAFTMTAGSAKNQAIYDAKIKMGKALVAIYGENAGVYSTPITASEANTYIDHTFAGTEKLADIQEVYYGTKAANYTDGLITTTETPWYGTDKYATNPYKYNAKTYAGRTPTTKTLDAVYQAKAVAFATVDDTYASDVLAKEAAIRNQVDAIVYAEQDYNEAVAARTSAEADVEAVDLEAYATVCADLKEALAAYNEAATAMKTLEAQANDINIEAQAIANLDPQVDVPTQIAASKAAIAKAKDNLDKANYQPVWDTDADGTPDAGAGTTVSVRVWDANAGTYNAATGTWSGAYVTTTTSVTYDDAIEFYETALEEAELKLAASMAELLLAQKALEAYEIDLDGDDEPAEEPETPEEPAEEPAEGGEETPAEGEGEAEGGEEA